MTHVWLLAAYAACALAVMTLSVALVRGGRLTPARVALLALIGSTMLWLGEAAWRLIAQPVDPTLAVAWAMPIAALAVAITRAVVRALNDPSWKATAATFLTFSVHPLAMVMTAAMPDMRSLAVVASADGTYSYGPVFWIHAAVSYVLLGSAVIEMLSAGDRIPFVAKHRPMTLIIAWALPPFMNLMRIFFGRPSDPDITPLGLTLTVAVLYVVVSRGGAPDLVPIARGKVFDQLVDAVFIVDTRGNLVDANEKARLMAGLDMKSPIPQGVSLHQAIPAIARVADIPGEHDVDLHGVPMVFHIAIGNLTDPHGKSLGRAVHARDVTQATKQRREFARMHNDLARGAQANERLRAELADQALRDAGTGLHNRRYILDLLPTFVAQCEKDRVPLSIVMLDLDHFKDVNDTWGHSVGDRVLSAAALAMEAATPPGVIARFGGEEFIVLLPGMTAEEASTRADAMRTACSDVVVRTREGTISLTASAGVAAAGPDAINTSDLIEAADAALYRAKNFRRNTTWVATESEVRI